MSQIQIHKMPKNLCVCFFVLLARSLARFSCIFQYNGNNGRKLWHPLLLTLYFLYRNSRFFFHLFMQWFFVLFNYFLLFFLILLHARIVFESVLLSLVSRKMQTIWLYLAHIVFVDLDETMTFFYDSSSTGCASITLIGLLLFASSNFHRSRKIHCKQMPVWR